MELIRVEVESLKTSSGRTFFRGKYKQWIGFGRSEHEVIQQIHWQMRGPGVDWQGRKRVRKIWNMLDFL